MPSALANWRAESGPFVGVHSPLKKKIANAALKENTAILSHGHLERPV